MAVEGIRITRRRLLALAGAAGASVFASRASAATRWVGNRTEASGVGYVSRPDLNPPAITVAVAADGAASRGYIFLAPFDISAASGAPATPARESHSGPLIIDDKGEPLWFLPMAAKTAMGVRVQLLDRRPVLTWYEGTVLGAYGGEFVVFDPTYHEVARVKAGRGRHGDLHEFLLTPERTALISIYREVTADLSSIGGGTAGRLVEGIVQEVDLASGRVLFEWRSREHVGLDESYQTGLTPAGNVDYFHLNSIDVDHDGNLLISARNTSAVYKIDRRSGKVLWRLGGTRSDVHIDDEASFAFQHDARRHPDGTLTIFDNNAADPSSKAASRGIRIALDMKSMRASLVQEYKTADTRTGWAMGNVQQLNDGGVFVGWGTNGSISEFDRHGRVRFDARFADASVDYRAFRMAWKGTPTGTPAIAVRQNDDSTMTVYASWNGATEITTWQVQTGRHPSQMKPTATRQRTGFETAINIPATHDYISVVALDATGRQLGKTPPLK